MIHLRRVVADRAERVNQRMHCKQLIVDNRAAILGGRNVGDEYMGLDSGFNFRDLDVLVLGLVFREASGVFDAYWNSDWVMPVTALEVEVSASDQVAARAELARRIAETPSLATIPGEPQDWSSEIAALGERFHVGVGRVNAD